MTRNELILNVKNELKVYGALPYSVSDDEINRIINQALNWFYVNYKESVETQYFVVPIKEFSSSDYKKTRSIQMPDCTVSIFEVKEISGGSRLFSIDKDFSDNRLIASELLLTPFQSDHLVLRTAQYAYWDLAQAFFLERLSFDFNRNTKKLKILGKDPTKDVFIQAYIKIPEERLFDDWFFIRYVTCQSKLSLARVLSTFKYKIIGGIEIDYDSIKSEANEELEKILQRIDDENSPDWFFIFH